MHRKIGHFYIASGHYKRMGLEGYQKAVTYCSIRGEDFENDLQAWEATSKLIEWPGLFNMAKSPYIGTDKGLPENPLCLL